MSSEPNSLITDTAALEALCGRLAKADFVTVDTEFMRETTYWAKLCLVQVAGPDEAYCIDPLAEGINLKPLYDLLANPAVLKVFHAGRQDLEIFYTATTTVPTPVFDSQVAAMVCGFGDQVGYETLVSKLAGANLDKSQRFTDWSQRPLSDRQIKYALGDVTYLRKVYTELSRMLDNSGRRAWLEEEIATLIDPATYRVDPRDSWQRIRARTRSRRLLCVLRELAAWRELTAQAMNLPRQRVAKDDALLELAANMPVTVDDIKRTRLAKPLASGKYVEGVLAAVAKGRAVPESECPVVERDNGWEAVASRGVVELLKLLLKARSETHHVAQRLIATSDDVEAIALSDTAEVPALHGWRRELFGEDALKLKHGKLAIGLSADGKNVEVFQR
ncbi:MAG: ribonuclease D [Rhodospirillaceae bacterium]|nr:ribonuclease D [Rhodospirillaceae bacterium]